LIFKLKEQWSCSEHRPALKAGVPGNSRIMRAACKPGDAISAIENAHLWLSGCGLFGQKSAGGLELFCKDTGVRKAP
jgi:hypothetical protein